jgi:8-oxo-dGTP diphosphatase
VGVQERQVRVVSAEIEVDGRYLLTQRSAAAVLPLLWEFPGGRVRSGETDQQALRRCLAERLGVAAEVDELLLLVEHSYPDYELTLVVYRVSLRGSPWARRVADLRFVPLEELGSYAFPPADRATVALLVADEGGEGSA